MHLAFFATSFFIDRIGSASANKSLDNYSYWELAERDAVLWLRYGHLLAIIYRLVETVINEFFNSDGMGERKHTHQNWVKMLISYLGYLIPIFYCFYCRQTRMFCGGVDYDDGTGFSFYMFSEMAFFFLFIISGSLFLALSFIFKLK